MELVKLLGHVDFSYYFFDFFWLFSLSPLLLPHYTHAGAPSCVPYLSDALFIFFFIPFTICSSNFIICIELSSSSLLLSSASPKELLLVPLLIFFHFGYCPVDEKLIG